MSKQKKGRSANKLIDSVLTDLKDGDEQQPKQVTNPFLDALRETRSEVDHTSPGVPFPDPEEPSELDVPEGLHVKEKPPIPKTAAAKTPEPLPEIPVKRDATLVMKNEPPVPTKDVAPAVIELPAVPEQSATLQLQPEYPEHKEEASSTQSMNNNTNLTDRTQPMAAAHRGIPDAPVKSAFGYNRPSGRDIGGSGYSDAQMIQAENLKLAQSRILELENEAEKLRQENELLTAAGTIAKNRLDEMIEKIHVVERAKMDAMEHAALEMKILKESLLERDRETSKARRKVEELETRLNSDLKKIRVRERELENRLELARLEKTALVRSKDETILDLKRKLDLISSELENYKQRTSELQGRIDNQNDQIGRTVRALRLALTNLESNDTSSENLLPMKKAE